MEVEKVQRIVRIMSTDIDGNIKTGMALREIRGISFMFSKAVCLSAGIDSSKKLGFLSKQEIEKLESVIKEAEKHMPRWMLNRRSDPETGLDSHSIGNVISLRGRDDINKLRKIRAYKGIRHELGLPVRGQRTRGSFRKNKTVGVSKKKALAARKGAPAAVEKK